MFSFQPGTRKSYAFSVGAFNDTLFAASLDHDLGAGISRMSKALMNSALGKASALTLDIFVEFPP